MPNNIMRNTIIVILLLLSTLISAQETEIDSIISHEIKVLKENKIRSFFILEKSCNGCIKLIEEYKLDCDYGTSKLYVFWKEKDESFFRKIDKCSASKVKIPSDIFNDYLAKTHRIKNETVKPYQIDKKSYIFSSHSTFSEFYFNIDEKIERKRYDDYSLTTEKEKPNINFKFNNSLTLIKLYKSCDEIIRQNP